mmetsp:Transcript_6022/g.22052  ORF Transcript_6022/g.22052 Transcript_6022/m.22052 type:complete len:270 (-) Transcript_6022:192-1001(-)
MPGSFRALGRVPFFLSSRLFFLWCSRTFFRILYLVRSVVRFERPLVLVFTMVPRGAHGGCGGGDDGDGGGGGGGGWGGGGRRRRRGGGGGRRRGHLGRACGRRGQHVVVGSVLAEVPDQHLAHVVQAAGRAVVVFVVLVVLLRDARHVAQQAVEAHGPPAPRRHVPGLRMASLRAAAAPPHAQGVTTLPRARGERGRDRRHEGRCALHARSGGSGSGGGGGGGCSRWIAASPPVCDGGGQRAAKRGHVPTRAGVGGTLPGAGGRRHPPP